MVINVFSTNSDCENISRKQMLLWLNDRVETKSHKIEDLRGGTAYCELLNLLFPNAIFPKRIRMNSKYDYENFYNFKLLQEAFKKLEIQKYVDTEKLMRGCTVAHLNFLQWFIKFYKANIDSGVQKSPSRHSLCLNRSRSSVVIRSHSDGDNKLNRSTSCPRAYKEKPVIDTNPNNMTNLLDKNLQVDWVQNNKRRAKALSKLLRLRRQMDQMKNQNNSIKDYATNMALQRNFFFDKLRQIEKLCQDEGNTSGVLAVNNIEEILYRIENDIATMENTFANEFTDVETDSMEDCAGDFDTKAAAIK